MEGSNENFDHNEYAKRKTATDFWGQIRRTVNGKPVSEDQIALIVEKISSALEVDENDRVLDLACGNGALSERIFSNCLEFQGVDFSEFLIDVALENFSVPPKFNFQLNDVYTFLKNEKSPERFSKGLCYGSFSYLCEAEAAKSLKLLYENFSGIERFFIGNLPDFDKYTLFYSKTPPKSMSDLKSHTTSIGIWRTKEEFECLAKNAGWNVEFSNMPEHFYSSGYRYDVLLTR